MYAMLMIEYFKLFLLVKRIIFNRSDSSWGCFNIKIYIHNLALNNTLLVKEVSYYRQLIQKDL